MPHRSKTSLLLTTALLSALLVVCAQIIVPIGPVPFSMALFGVFFIGAMLPPLYTAACISTYLLLGSVGLPVFAGAMGGPQVLAGPTGGYLVGYFALALAVSLANQYKLPFWMQFAAACGGLLVCYLFGTVWFMIWSSMGFWQSFVTCVFFFILPDITKALLALMLAKMLKKRLQKGGAAG